MRTTLPVVLALVMVIAISCAAPTPTPTPTATPGPSPTATPTPMALPTPTSTPTLTVSKVQEIKTRGKLIVAVRQESGARGILLDPVHLKTRGLEVALARAIAKKLLGDENKVELRSGPALAVVSTVQEGQVDLGLATIFHAPTTDALKQQVEVSEPFATGGVALITKIGSSISTLKDLNGKKVARIEVGRDYRPEFETFAKQRGFSIAIEQFASYDEVAAAMERDQAQAMLGHTIALTAYMAQNPGRFVFLGKPFTSEQFAVVAKKGDSELIAIVSQVIKELKASGELQGLAERAGFPVESLALP